MPETDRKPPQSPYFTGRDFCPDCGTGPLVLTNFGTVDDPAWRYADSYGDFHRPMSGPCINLVRRGVTR